MSAFQVYPDPDKFHLGYGNTVVMQLMRYSSCEHISP